MNASSHLCFRSLLIVYFCSGDSQPVPAERRSAARSRSCGGRAVPARPGWGVSGDQQRELGTVDAGHEGGECRPTGWVLCWKRADHMRTQTCTHARARTHTRTHTHIHSHTLTCKYVHAHTCTHSHTHTHIHTHIHTHTCTHSHTHSHIYTHSHINTHRHTHTRAHTPKYLILCVCSWSVWGMWTVD